ncbi:hypothetical protein IFR05_010742 [Cadophora sp. M221]|nr:hypothetical protein IFR05_010742 [Cadophora sp. M221]
MALQVFGLFGSLPAELHVIIWKEAAGKDVARTIDVEFRCNHPAYVPPMTPRRGAAAVRAIGGPRAYFRWTWTCVPVSGGLGPTELDGMLRINHEARHEYLKLNPDFLRLGDGPRIHFKAVRDVIYMDALSLFTLHIYATAPDHLLPVETFRDSLQGFGLIRMLETGIRRMNIAGLSPGTRFFANQSIFTGLIRPIMPRVIPAAISAAAGNTHNRVGVWHIMTAYNMGLQGLHHSQRRVVDLIFHRPAGDPGLPGIKNDVILFFL